MITSIYLADGKLDLHEDDNIELDSSLVNIQDISKIFTDSTNSFSVPATDNNNKRFKHFYNPKLVNGWDIFNKVVAVIELEGAFYKQVKLSLNGVTLSNGKPKDYNIQMFGLLTSLIDKLGDDKLSDLDFSSLDFNLDSQVAFTQLSNYTESNPPSILRTSLSTRRLIYDSDPATINTETIDNIANNNTGFDNGIRWNNTGVSIRCIKVIEAIESKYNLTFSRDYFSRVNFSLLYMLLSGGGVEKEIEQQITGMSSDDPTLFNQEVLLSTNLPFIELKSIKIFIECQGANKRDELTSIVKANGVEIHSVTASGDANGLIIYRIYKKDFEVFENLTFHVKSKSVLDFRYTVENADIGVRVTYESQRGFGNLTGQFIVSDNMPDIKVIDFLSGLFKKDKLIAFNTDDDNITLEDLNTYYRKGKVRNITKYIDTKEIPLSVGTIFNQIDYKFKEPQTLLQNQFFKNNGRYYGNLDFKLLDDNDKLVKGKSIKIELPFENMIYERLQDLNGVDDVDFQYGFMADESLEPVTVTGHLHYVHRISLTASNTVKVITGSNSYAEMQYIHIPLHTSGVTLPQYSTVFGNEFNEYNGNSIQNTIYSNFHENYISEIFSKNKRIFKFKAKNLPTELLKNIALNDVLEIKDTYYRINKYKLNLLTKECDFELWNVDNLDLTPLVSYTTDMTTITTDSIIITTDRT